MPKNNSLSISQNFLTSKATIERMLRGTNLCKNDCVMEIGAGKGHITSALSTRCSQVIAYELDGRLCAALAPKLSPNVRLIEGDFLKAKLPKTPYKVFANIPFSRTAEIIRKLTDNADAPAQTWLVMEKGAAKRFCGLPKENVSSLLLKPFFKVEIVYYLQRTDFHPSPRVDAVLLHLERKSVPDIAESEKKQYEKFIRIARGVAGKLLTKKQVSTALRIAKLPQIGPSGLVSYVQWLCLFRCWLRYGQPNRF